MNAKLKLGNRSCLIDFSNFNDLSIPINFNGTQPNTYNVEKASSEPYKDDSFIGDTRRGGPCNFETYKITPHCNGTHTECIGHITDERISINLALDQVFFTSTLISVTPTSNKETYIPNLNSDDLVITKEMLYKRLHDISDLFLEGLIIRTRPNSVQKMSQNYMEAPSPFFTLEAMQYIRNRGVKHLLVDIPSVDRLFDDGRLSCHNIFWDTKDKKYNSETKNYTITEMIYVDDKIQDGQYLLNLQIPSFVSDAAPSRPIIFKLNDL